MDRKPLETRKGGGSREHRHGWVTVYEGSESALIRSPVTFQYAPV